MLRVKQILPLTLLISVSTPAFSFFVNPLCNNLLMLAPGAQGPFASLPRSLPHFKQDVNGKCGPTSLGIALGYFGKIFPQNHADPFDIANQATAAVTYIASVQSAARGLPLTNLIHLSVATNSQEALSDTARAYGLHSVYGRATLTQIASYVAAGEVVLVHWWMGPGLLDQHWSAIQYISGTTIELRDPWPENPSRNVKSTNEFFYRSWTEIPGVFSIVRISDHPIVLIN